MARKIFAFLKKDFLVETSYRFSFFSSLFSVFISLLGYFFIDKLFGYRIVSQLEEFGVSYFSYALLSTAFFGYVGVGLGSFSERIRAEQAEGTLEALLLTPTKLNTILFSMTLWNMAFATFEMAVYILVGIFAFNVDFSHINILSAIVVFMLTVLSFNSLGILSASFIMVFKRGNPVGWLISSMEGLIGGVFFPVTVLPAWLQCAANFFPITYAIRAIQLSVYRGYSVMQLSRELVFLLLFSLVLSPLSIALFKYSAKKAKMDGSLAQY